MEITNMNDALVAWRLIESKQDELKAEYDRKNGKYESARKQVEIFMLQCMRDQGVTEMEVPHLGHPKIVDKRFFGCADWGLFYPWCVENNRPDMFQKRLLGSAMDQYLEETGGLPPACTVETTRTVVVLKGKG